MFLFPVVLLVWGYCRIKHEGDFLLSVNGARLFNMVYDTAYLWYTDELLINFNEDRGFFLLGLNFVPELVFKLLCEKSKNTINAFNIILMDVFS